MQTSIPGGVTRPEETPRWIERNELDRDAATRSFVQYLVARFGRELSVAVARSSLAPHVFVSRGAQGVFFINRRPGTALAFAYAGPDDRFAEAAQDLFEYAGRAKLTANVLEEEPKAMELAALGYTATPFGVMQRLTRLDEFSLEGTRMRRLRYQVGHYNGLGGCETREYRAGSDAGTDHALADLVDAWKSGKKQVGPYVDHFRSRIAAGDLPAHCRVFLTHRDTLLDNAVVISRLPAANGYLMDLEFYGPDMPLGGLEFAISRILETLSREGATCFSLGATFGTQLEACPEEDARVGKMLRGLHVARIFNNDGNFQFKNKFRPQNTRLYVSRPRSAPSASFTDVLMIFADPENRRQSRQEAPPGAPQAAVAAPRA